MQWWLSVGAMVMAAASWLTEGAGGTLVIRTDNNPVQPIAIALSGPVEREVPLDGAHAVAVSGLPAGRYEMRPLFVGTVTGAGVHVEVSDGRVTDAPLPLGDVGGVRFDADPGMCEPDHDWTFGFLLPVGANHPANRPSANRPLPTAKTCQREVGGLAPGSYRVQVTPPHRELPAFYTALLVRSGTWTSIRMARPPVVVRGRITSNGDPVAGIRVDIRPMAAPPSIGVAQAVMGLAFTGVTDSDGRYAIGLSTPGTFRQTLRQIGQAELPGIPKQIDLRLGVNHNDLEIGGGTLRVWLTERGATMPPDRPVTLSIQSLPQPPQRRIIANPSEPFDMRVITPGRYVVSATAQSVDSAGRPVTLIAAQQQEVDIRSSLTTDVWIDLIHRDEMWLDVFYADGMPSRGAYVVPHPGAASLRTDDQGRVSLATVPVGTRLPIRTRMFGITCHTVTSDLMQRVVVPDASETLIITVTGSTTPAEGRAILGGATIAGAPGATCPVPFEGFSVAESRGADSVDFKFQLPPGVYTVTLRDGRVLTVPAPGRLEIGETQIR